MFCVSGCYGVLMGPDNFLKHMYGLAETLLGRAIVFPPWAAMCNGVNTTAARAAAKKIAGRTANRSATGADRADPELHGWLSWMPSGGQLGNQIFNWAGVVGIAKDTGMKLCRQAQNTFLGYLADVFVGPLPPPCPPPRSPPLHSIASPATCP